MRERNADGVVDLRRAGEGRIKILPIKLADDFEADLARHLPMKFAAGEFTGGLPAHMDREWWRCVVEELFGVIVGEDDPEVGVQGAKPLTDIGGHLPDMLDIL